jgi:hypothetical protein
VNNRCIVQRSCCTTYLLSYLRAALPPIPQAARAATWRLRLRQSALAALTSMSATPRSLVALFAREPDGAEYLWDLGDGMTYPGRLCKHVYDSPGRYVVTLRAQKRDGRKFVRYEAQTAFLVLEPPSLPTNQQTFVNELVRVTVIAPKSLAVGQEAQVRYVFTALQRLVYLDVRSVPDRHLFSKHDGYSRDSRWSNFGVWLLCAWMGKGISSTSSSERREDRHGNP